ncbi:MAG: hypothetical protein K2M81_03810, partial [Lachnospiraceae bacterium]|nr:hypothetical protein [Lachnospiraceae bacterium]
MNDIAEIIASIAESYIEVRLCNRFLGFKNKNRTMLKSVGCFSILILGNILDTQKNGYLTKLWESLFCLSSILILGAYAFLFLEGKFFDKLLVSLMPAIAILPINLFVFNVIRTLSGVSTADIIEPGGKARIWALIFSKLAYFLVCEFVIHMRKRSRYSLSIFQ